MDFNKSRNLTSGPRMKFKSNERILQGYRTGDILQHQVLFFLEAAPRTASPQPQEQPEDEAEQWA